MKLKFNQSIILIILVAAGTMAFTGVVLNRMHSMTVRLTIAKLQNIANTQATYWQIWQERQLSHVHTLANAMAGYDGIPAEIRRAWLDTMLESTIKNNDDLVTLYTVWKPHAVDGIDAANPTGQYATTYSREGGQLRRLTADLDETVVYVNSPDSGRETVEALFAGNVGGRDAYLLKMTAPIINSHTNEVVGSVGCTYDMAETQQALEKTMKEDTAIAAMALYGSDGFIVASYVPALVGKNLLDADTIYGGKIQDAYNAVINGLEIQIRTYSRAFGSNVRMILKPFTINNANATWTVMVGANEEFMSYGIHKKIRFTFTLAATALVIELAVLFVLLKRKPIVSDKHDNRSIKKRTRTIQPHSRCMYYKVKIETSTTKRSD